MRRADLRGVRVGCALYTGLLRAMPRRYREGFGAESVADLRRLLEEAERDPEQSVSRSIVRACLDLLTRLPGEWWAAVRFSHAERGRGSGRGALGWGERSMNALDDLRKSARTLARRPGFTTIAVLTLALGIGANVAIFSIVNAVLLRPLPYDESGRIVEIRHHAPGLDLPELRNSEGLLEFYRESADFLGPIAAFGGGSANLTGEQAATRVRVQNVDPEIFQVLGVQPMTGRPFGPADAAEGAPTVVLLGYDLWRSRFGSDPTLVGSTIRMDGDPIEVVGIMPEGFAFPDDDTDLYVPMRDVANPSFGNFGMRAVSRLPDGISVDVAQARATELRSRLPEAFDLQEGFLESAGFSVTIASLRDRTVADIESTLWIIFGTVAFVLLIACANVANLFLVRGESRRKEMAVRAAMGAGRGRVAASVLSESLILGLAGGAVGVSLALVGVRTLLAVSELPRAGEVSIDAASLVLAALLSVTAAVAFGGVSMTRFVGARFARVLRDGGRGSTGGRERHRMRNLLVASQLALGLVLMVGSGLMLRSFAELRGVDLGFEPDAVLTMGLNRDTGEEPGVATRYYGEVADRIGALPGVVEVGITTQLPLATGGSNGGSFFIESRPRQEEELPPVALYRAVGAAYFSSLGIPVLKGRNLERGDVEESRRVVWVNEAFERLHLDGDALGERISWSSGPSEEGSETPWAEIVGVVGDVRELDLTEEVRPYAYLPISIQGTAGIETESAFLTIEVEAGSDPMSVAAAAQEVVRGLDANVPITATRTMGEVVDGAMRSTSLTMGVLAVATAMALFLAAIGLAGVISYVVGQRTREIGVRVALGASVAAVRGLVLRQSLVVIAGGTVLGLLGASALTRSMEALLFGVSATDPLTFVAAPVVLLAVSLAATWVPVRRATRVDPTEALRAE